MPTTAKQRIGAKGEAIARTYLQSIGYKIYKCNWRVGHDEVDIIAYDPVDKVMVFAEVKTRSRHTGHNPSINITHHKLAAMRRAMRRWVALHNYQRGYRIDVICVVANEVVHHNREVGAM